MKRSQLLKPQNAYGCSVISITPTQNGIALFHHRPALSPCKLRANSTTLVMGSTPRRLKNFPASKRPVSSHYRRSKPRHQKSTITRTSSVSDKLEALKNLIPAQEIEDAGAGASTSSADKLFKETADYILLLRTQVSILQKLVDFYGSSSSSSLVQQ